MWNAVMWLSFVSSVFPRRHQMASQLWAVLYQHPAWLLTLLQLKCHLTWPTVLLLQVMWLDMGGNMPAAPLCPPTTVTFPHRWLSRECRQPEKVATLWRLPHSDGNFYFQPLHFGLLSQQIHPLFTPHPSSGPALLPRELAVWIHNLCADDT